MNNTEGLYYCKCNNCGNEWDLFDTEEFNMSFCYTCFSGDVDTIDGDEEYNEEDDD